MTKTLLDKFYYVAKTHIFTLTYSSIVILTNLINKLFFFLFNLFSIRLVHYFRCVGPKITPCINLESIHFKFTEWTIHYLKSLANYNFPYTI